MAEFDKEAYLQSVFAGVYDPPPAVAAIPPREAKTGFFNALKSGALGVEADVAAIGTTGMDSAARRKSIELGKDAEAAYQGPSWSDVKADPISGKPWEFIKGSAGQTLGAMPAYIAAGWAGGAAGAAAGAPIAGVGAVPGAAIGSTLGMAPLFYGAGVRRQTQEQEAAIARGETPAEYSFGRAAAAAPVESALERFALGKVFKGTRLGTVLGHEGEKLSGEALKKVAGEGAIKTFGKGAARGIAAEVPVEVGQQVGERWQANLDLTSPEAMREYEDTVAGTIAGISPISGISGIARRSGARKQFRDLTKPVAEQEPPVPEQPVEGAIQPRSPLQEQIDVTTGVTRTPYQSAMEDALNQVIGTVGDRNVTAWEQHMAAYPELFPQKGQKKSAQQKPVIEAGEAPAVAAMPKTPADAWSANAPMDDDTFPAWSDLTEAHKKAANKAYSSLLRKGKDAEYMGVLDDIHAEHLQQAPIKRAGEAFVAAGAGHAGPITALARRKDIAGDPEKLAEALLGNAADDKVKNAHQYAAAYGAMTNQTPEGVQNAIQERRAAEEVPSAGAAGQAITQSGEGVGQGEQGAEVAQAGQAQKDALTEFESKLPTQQKAVFGLIRTALDNNELDKYVQADGSWNAQAIAEAAGFKARGNVTSAVKQLQNKLNAAAGKDVKAALAASVMAKRSTEGSDYERLGLSPAHQAATANETDYLGGEGVDQSMGVISSPGGSQGATGADVTGPMSQADRATEMEARRVVREGGAQTPEIVMGVPNEAAIAAAKQSKIMAVVEGLRTGDLTDAIAAWNDVATKIDGLEQIPTDLSSIEMNDQTLDALNEVLGAYQQVMEDESLAIEARRSFDTEGAYESAFRDVIRARTLNAAKLVTDARTAEERLFGTEPETRAGAEPVGKRPAATGETTENGRPATGGWKFPEQPAAVRPVKVEVKKRRVAGPKTAKSETPGVENPHTKTSLDNFLEGLFRSSERMGRVVTVYETQAEAATKNPDLNFSEVKSRIGGFKTTDGKVGLIAEHIAQGQELGIVLHEIGVHLGMEKLVGKANMKWLQGRVQAWAKLTDGTVENLAAIAAVRRAEKSSSANKDEELIAYMVEELVTNHGVNPQAFGTSNVQQWFRRMFAAMKVALRKIGLKRTDFDGQNMVDLAYGAAEIEMNGSAPSVAPSASKTKFSEAAAKTDEVTKHFKSWDKFYAALPYIEKTHDVTSKVKQTDGSWLITTKERVAKQGAQFSEIAPQTSAMAERLGGPVLKQVVTDVSHYLKIAATSLEGLHDTVARVKKTLPTVTDWYKGVMDMRATRVAIERKADAVAALASKLSQDSYKKTNAFIEKATVEQKWYRQPEWLKSTVVVDPEMAYEWSKLTPEEQAVADGVFKFGEESHTELTKLFKQLGVSDVFTQLGKIAGPYAPLKRFGGFVGLLKSQALLDAEQAAKDSGTTANLAKVEDLRKDSKHFVAKKFYTLGQAKTFTDQNAGKYAYAVPFTEADRLDDKSSMGYKQLQKIMAAVNANTESLPDGARESMRQMVKSIYMTTVDQTSARQSGQKRKGIAGYDENMINSFATHARSHAAFVASIAHGPEVNDAFYTMQQEAKDDKHAGADDFNLIARHYASMTQYDPSPISDAVTAGTTVWMLSTNLSYHVQNFLQGVMKSVPKLAADFGAGNYGEAWRHMLDGYKLMGAISNHGQNPDLTLVKDAGLRAALTYAADHGMLDVGIEEDLSHFGRAQTGYVMVDGASQLVGTVLHKLRQVARTVESWNRVSSGAAAYNMAIAHGKTPAQAQAYTMDMLTMTQGDVARATAPLLIKKMPRVMAQYKRFQFMSAAMYAKAMYQAFKGASPEERAIGRRMTGFLLAHTSVAGGVLALPLLNVASLAFGMFGGDDDPEDMDTVIRRNFGEGLVSDFILDGAPKALLGVDMSAKLSDRNLFSIAPYTDFDFTSKAGVISTVAGVAGGPALSQAGKMAAGVGLMQQGALYKGVEKMLPKGLESAMQAFRLANDGVTLKNGDVVITPDDLSAYDLALSAVGIPTAQMREITRNQSVQYDVRKFYSERTKDITQKYIAAERDKDTAEMAELRVRWTDMQSSKDRARYLFNDVPQELKRQPLSSLNRAVQNARKRQRQEQRVAA